MGIYKIKRICPNCNQEKTLKSTIKISVCNVYKCQCSNNLENQLQKYEQTKEHKLLNKNWSLNYTEKKDDKTRYHIKEYYACENCIDEKEKYLYKTIYFDKN